MPPPNVWRYICVFSDNPVLRRLLHILCSLWLAVLLTLGITPAEAIHAFADHKDTIHRHGQQGPVVEREHHHCDFLQFQLMPFQAPPALPLPRPPQAILHRSALLLQDERATQQTVALREGRGPPAAAWRIS